LKNSYMKSKEWIMGVYDELNFWRSWFETKGLDWPEDYAKRVNKNTEIEGILTGFIKTGDELILDAGSGPLSILGKMWKGKPLNITCCDALAEGYGKLLRDFNIDALVPVQCDLENIDSVFAKDNFDIVHACNCVDHCYDPISAIVGMLAVCKPTGVLVLHHEINEAINENYQGLHQWNFYEHGGNFYIASKDYRICMNEHLLGTAVIETTTYNGHITNILRRI
jgi:SAM-dependent methyltransferase